MTSINELWVLEWSPRQTAFHVQTLAESLKSTQRAFVKNMALDWMVLGIYRTSVDAHKAADTFLSADFEGAKAMRKKELES